jgi:hypothetical protein
MKKTCFLFLISLFLYNPLYSQKIVNLNTKAISIDSSFTIKLIKRFQNKRPEQNSKQDVYDRDIYSPKSVNILDAKNKFYVNSLEGYSTVVYDLKTFQKLKVIKHEFNDKNNFLFKDTSYYNYKFTTVKNKINNFKGKPVEGCFSHNGKYFWVSYYRRNYDQNAVDPSAICIIDTDKDSIVRVMPSGVLPKVIKYSKESNKIIITNWGDNTVSLIDVSSSNPNDFKYIANVTIDKRYEVKIKNNSLIDRDKFCGDCLRGTVFSPDGNYAFIGKMMNTSLAVVDVNNGEYLGSITGMMPNIRHILVKDGYIYLAITNLGYIQRGKIDAVIDSLKNNKLNITQWENIYVGKGIRTMEISEDGLYLFAAVNEESKIAIVDLSKLQTICKIDADSFPVGLDITKDKNYLIVTAQGKYGIGGNSVMVYKVDYKNKN